MELLNGKLSTRQNSVRTITNTKKKLAGRKYIFAGKLFGGKTWKLTDAVRISRRK